MSLKYDRPTRDWVQNANGIEALVFSTGHWGPVGRAVPPTRTDSQLDVRLSLNRAFVNAGPSPPWSRWPALGAIVSCPVSCPTHDMRHVPATRSRLARRRTIRTSPTGSTWRRVQGLYIYIIYI